MWFIPCYSNQNAGIPTSSQSVQVVDFNAPVVNTLTQLWQPFLSQGRLVEHYLKEKTLFKESTVVNLDINDLTTTAMKLCKPDAPGLEIGSFLLGAEAVEVIKKQIDLTTLFPGQKVEMVARKLLIATTAYQNGRCSYNLDTTQERIGTVEVLLNSAFTGGELRVVCGDQSTDLQPAPYSWVAMHSDISCSLSPVTSGARVSLIYDVNIIHVPVDSTPLFIEGYFVHTNCNLISDMTDAAFDVTKLISIAEQMNPELVGEGDLTIDPSVLNASTLTALGRKAELSDYFGTEYVVTKPKYLAIHRTREYATREKTNMDLGEGYLGTLVMTLDTDYNHHLASLRRNEQRTSFCPATRRWYAYRADTKQNIDINVCGTVVALHYDVYSCKRPDLIHNPLPTYDTISGTDSILTRSIVPEHLSAQLLGVLEKELASADAVIITLQQLFPEGPTDQLWNTYPSSLQGGDRVLYDILSGTSHFSERYSVQLVEVTLQCQYERGVCRDRILSEKCTFKHFADPLAIPTKPTEPCDVKLIVATKLTGKHRVKRSYTLNKTYQVYGLYVGKKM